MRRPGNMVAAGWVYAKSASTLTVGDGRIVVDDAAGRPLPAPVKRYEETYAVAANANVYVVDTSDYSKSGTSSFASVPVTKDYNYAATTRQAVYVVFDDNFTHAASAKVRSIYYFTPPSVSDGKPVWDLPSESAMLKARGNDLVSGKPYVSIVATGPQRAPYASSTEPFAIIKNVFYYVGDTEVTMYLFRTDNRLILLDAGWPNSGYQYWKNIEAVGFDPRKITDLFLTHGHIDHYGAALELVHMVENAGGSIQVHGTKEDTIGITQDALGNSWNIRGALPESETELRKRTIFYEYDKVMDYGNVKFLVTPTPGHTPGTASFIFTVRDPETGKDIRFGYIGGYGVNGISTPTATNGYLRLSFQLGLAWLQQMQDVDFVTPQHTNQYPLVEVYQALKARNREPGNESKPLTMLDALTKGEFINYCEKRYEVITNALSDKTNPQYKSIETSGPFKPGRENGLKNVRVRLMDSGKVIRGFNSHQNVNPLIPLLKDGIVIDRDSFVHDPDGWYVQAYLDVLDNYGGFLPGSGPVESMRPTPGAPEVLRTQRLNSQADAEAILAILKKGSTYYVDLTKASAIISGDIKATFRRAEDPTH